MMMNSKANLMAIFSIVLVALVNTATAEEWAAPDVIVKETTVNILGVIDANRARLKQNPEELFGLVDEYVLPHFDFYKISQWVLGKNWRTATPEQRERFVAAFQTMLVRTYATAILEYSDLEFTYHPLRMKAGDTIVTVRTEVLRPGKQPVRIDYRMFLGKAGWKVFDVQVDGVSLVASYRTTFDSEIQSDGMEALISRLEQHNKDKQR